VGEDRYVDLLETIESLGHECLGRVGVRKVRDDDSLIATRCTGHEDAE
jgi:hypothetical protein